MIAISIIPSALADITLHNIDEEYYLGEELIVNTTIESDKDLYGFLSLSLVCPDTSFEYFRIPMVLDEDVSVKVESEPLILSRKITKSDKCSVLAKFSDQENDVIFDERSDKFAINSGFEFGVSVNERVFAPGNTLKADITVYVPGETIRKMNLDIILGKKLTSYELTENHLTIQHVIPADMPSGKQKIFFEINDGYGNQEEFEQEIEILQTPTSIRNTLSRTNFYADQANESFNFTTELLDQGGELIKDNVLYVKVLDPDGDSVYYESVKSGEIFVWNLNRGLKPGDYNILSEYEGIREVSTIKVANKDYKKVLEELEQTVNSNESIVDASDQEGKSDIGFNGWSYLMWFIIVLAILYVFYKAGRSHERRRNKKSKKGKDIWS
ncbi:hypothetical protein H6503_02155 [Candidatus Woesearchaeota archaeon]|nr:hypothetical protein [Candidatus Woesearchaeota archaeon]